jgi:hypothetical protein
MVIFLYLTHHNPIPLVKKDVEQEDEAAIMPKMKFTRIDDVFKG